MQKPLAGKKIAVLVASGFEEVQMTEPQKALLALGATIQLVSPEGLVNGWHGDAWGHYFPVDAQISTMLSADYDMLIVPGGARSLAKLSGNPHTKRIVSAFVDDLKPVALIGEGVEVLLAADRAEGVKVTGLEGSRAAMEQAKATWVEDKAVHVEGHILSATGADMPLFLAEMTTLFVGEDQVRDAA
jgi:putative intracellular protease/amidase